MKKKLSSIAGVTLIEILIGIIISTIMMGAMYTSYSVVNNTYSQVTDRAKISSAGRDVVGMILRDIRMAGWKHFGDTIGGSDLLAPILITKAANLATGCDKIEISYGDVDYLSTRTPKYLYKRYKMIYECQDSASDPGNAFQVVKSRFLWSTTSNDWIADTTTDGDSSTYKNEIVLDFVSDFVFNAIDDTGALIDPPPTATNSTKDKLYKIKTVDIGLTVRSTKPFFRSSRVRSILGLADTSRDRQFTGEDSKYLRDTIIVTAHARNLGLQ